MGRSGGPAPIRSEKGIEKEDEGEEDGELGAESERAGGGGHAGPVTEGVGFADEGWIVD